VANLVTGVFEHHDKARFETIGISFGPPDDSGLTERIKGSLDRFIDVRTKTDAEIAELMHGMKIDIAVDLMGFTQNSRTNVLAMRPAPVQVNYLGYPGTMGADFIDYIVGDGVLMPPDHEAFYSEKI